MFSLEDFVKISDSVWQIPKAYRADMRVPARVYASRMLLEAAFDGRSLDQLVNVATLPGIERFALAMPDIRQGHGFPIGSVAAFRAEDGVISPGGVGYDINCGVRLLASGLRRTDLSDKQVVALTSQIQHDVPTGIGRGGAFALTDAELDDALLRGARSTIGQNLARPDDLKKTEEGGSHPDADPTLVSDKAKHRGRDQIGTLGAGDHLLELQEITAIYDETTAAAFGLGLGQITVMIHSGSRGLGHQTCTDYVRLMGPTMKKYGIPSTDRELACVPFASKEGQGYYRAMAACANFAWMNRQAIAHLVRGAWKSVLGKEAADGLVQIYDVAHNMAKKETHGGKEYIVHRKGATRAFPGDPVLIPGSAASYVLAGTEKAMQETWGSCGHGADVDEIMKTIRENGIALPVARMRPLSVSKG